MSELEAKLARLFPLAVHIGVYADYCTIHIEVWMPGGQEEDETEHIGAAYVGTYTPNVGYYFQPDFDGWGFTNEDCAPFYVGPDFNIDLGDDPLGDWHGRNE